MCRVRNFLLVCRNNIDIEAEACAHLTTLTSIVKVKERIVLREIHLRTTGRHLSM